MRATVLTLAGFFSLLALTTTNAAENAVGPVAVPTFHCIGLYWSPPNGATNKNVLVQFRRAGETAWNEGLPMRYNPIAGTDQDLADYRGSIVDLTPGASYEIALKLADDSAKTNLTAKTWSETFPIGETTVVTNRDTPLEIKQSGTAEKWRVYDGKGATIDVRHLHDACITVNASFIIIRNFILKGAGATNIAPERIIGAIRINSGHNIVIEDCEISDWGRLDPKTGFGVDYDSAIFSNREEVKRLVVQRNKMHHPTFDGSNWYEPKYPTHSMGPQVITLFNTGGNHVIRYNECYSDMEHMFNDGIGGGSNGSYRGAPGHDSDIYGNFISHCWDDGIEAEGAGRNVRIWGNYIEQSMMMIGNAATSIGPLYIWKNVVARSQWQPNSPGGNFLKMGYAGGEQWMTGQMYIFHNTIFRSDEWLPTGGLGSDRIVKHTVSRNNILHMREPRNWSASNNKNNINNDFDYDLYNGRVPETHQKHGVKGEPIYIAGAGLNRESKSGNFQLADNSPGVAAGEAIPNFTGASKKPDIGAHQRGEAPIQYGVRAGKR